MFYKIFDIWNNLTVECLKESKKIKILNACKKCMLISIYKEAMSNDKKLSGFIWLKSGLYYEKRRALIIRVAINKDVYNYYITYKITI